MGENSRTNQPSETHSTGSLMVGKAGLAMSSNARCDAPAGVLATAVPATISSSHRFLGIREVQRTRSSISRGRLPFQGCLVRAPHGGRRSPGRPVGLTLGCLTDSEIQWNCWNGGMGSDTRLNHFSSLLWFFDVATGECDEPDGTSCQDRPLENACLDFQPPGPAGSPKACNDARRNEVTILP
jgi:hypothetical protein